MDSSEQLMHEATERERSPYLSYLKPRMPHIAALRCALSLLLLASLCSDSDLEELLHYGEIAEACCEAAARGSQASSETLFVLAVSPTVLLLLSSSGFFRHQGRRLRAGLPWPRSSSTPYDPL